MDSLSAVVPKMRRLRINIILSLCCRNNSPKQTRLGESIQFDQTCQICDCGWSPQVQRPQGAPAAKLPWCSKSGTECCKNILYVVDKMQSL
jgi:Cft2 family RNA processing exonuclease